MLVSAEEDSDNDGVADKWEEYVDGRLASVGFDTEKAGRPTRRLVYDRSGQLLPGDGRRRQSARGQAVSRAVAMVFSLPND